MSTKMLCLQLMTRTTGNKREVRNKREPISDPMPVLYPRNSNPTFPK